MEEFKKPLMKMNCINCAYCNGSEICINEYYGADLKEYIKDYGCDEWKPSVDYFFKLCAKLPNQIRGDVEHDYMELEDVCRVKKCKSLEEIKDKLTYID